MKPVAIIGAGITGLTAAFYLKRKGIPVTVYEAGGALAASFNRCAKTAGCRVWAEHDSGNLAENRPARSRRGSGIAPALSRSESRGELCRPLQTAHCDAGFALRFFHNETFHRQSQAGCVARTVCAAAPGWWEESIAEFVKRRLNQEFLDHAIDALVAGVYAGDPCRFSLMHAFPQAQGAGGQLRLADQRPDFRRGRAETERRNGQGSRAKIFL